MINFFMERIAAVATGVIIIVVGLISPKTIMGWLQEIFEELSNEG